ncbi:MAG: ABC-2 type transport system permease protein [Gammaproteobacteria bacterium]|jgi:ABC-2 type transport system permease protein
MSQDSIPQWKKNWVAYTTITRREILRFSRIWVQTLVPPVVMTGLYFVIFGNLIGRQIGDMDGMAYVDFIMPGLVMMSIITNSYANVVSSFYGAKYSHHIEEMQIAPIPNIIIMLGFITGGVVRGLCVGITVTLVSQIFTDFSMHSPLVIIVVAILTAFLFSLAGLINGVFAKSFDDVSVVPTFVLTPLTYLGGIFYSIKLLPEFWQQASLANPILYMVNSFRYGFRGISDIDLTTAIGVILLFIVILFSACLVLLERGIGTRQ